MSHHTQASPPGFASVRSPIRSNHATGENHSLVKIRRAPGAPSRFSSRYVATLHDAAITPATAAIPRSHVVSHVSNMIRFQSDSVDLRLAAYAMPLSRERRSVVLESARRSRAARRLQRLVSQHSGVEIPAYAFRPPYRGDVRALTTKPSRIASATSSDNPS